VGWWRWFVCIKSLSCLAESRGIASPVVLLLAVLRLYETTSFESVREENRGPNTEEETAHATSPSKPRESLRNKSLYISLIWKWTVISFSYPAILAGTFVWYLIRREPFRKRLVILCTPQFPLYSDCRRITDYFSDNNTNYINILWHVEPLLGIDRETN
jgi:hypothetical protein